VFDVLPDWAPTGGAVGLLGAVVVMILLGRLIPIRTHAAIVADKNAQIDTWKAAHAAEVERADKLAKTVGELTEVARTGVAVMQAIPRPSPKDAVL
jgi:hypothetical protein